MDVKIDLHCHLDGSLNKEYISNILGEEVSAEELEVSSNCKSLTEYLTKFQRPLEAMGTLEGTRKLSEIFLRDISKEGMDYIEVRFAPSLLTNDEKQMERIIECVLEGLNKGKQYSQINYNIIVCGMRHHEIEKNIKTLKVARAYLKEGVCALDLAGDESKFPTRNFYELFQKAKQLDMPFTIHAGECGSEREVADAIEFGASRIGHGIAMRGNLTIQKLCKQKGIGIELCPTSNFQTRAIERDAKYPLVEFLQNQLLVTLNTDNRTVSRTTLTKEYELATKELGVKEEDIRQLQMNAIEVAFADEDTKHELWKRIK